MSPVPSVLRSNESRSAALRSSLAWCGVRQSLERVERAEPHPEHQEDPMNDNDDGWIDKLLLRPDEVAILLDVPLRTIYRWDRYRDGPRGYHIGRHVRYRVDDIERWLEDHRDPQSTIPRGARRWLTSTPRSCGAVARPLPRSLRSGTIEDVRGAATRRSSSRPSSTRSSSAGTSTPMRGTYLRAFLGPLAREPDLRRLDREAVRAVSASTSCPRSAISNSGRSGRRPSRAGCEERRTAARRATLGCISPTSRRSSVPRSRTA